MLLQWMVLNYFLKKSIMILDKIIVRRDIMEEKVRPMVPAHDRLWDLSPKEEFGAKDSIVWILPGYSHTSVSAAGMPHLYFPSLVFMCINPSCWYHLSLTWLLCTDCLWDAIKYNNKEAVYVLSILFVCAFTNQKKSLRAWIVWLFLILTGPVHYVTASEQNKNLF